MENSVKLIPKEMKGSIWDENGNAKVVQILISHGTSEVNSIQFAHVVDGKVVSSEMHGNPNGSKFDIITFDYPGEYLISIFADHDANGLGSITFSTNKRKYGPFGGPSSNYSSYQHDTVTYNFKPRSSFGGFHGSILDSKMYAIGVYIRPLGSLAEIETDVGSDSVIIDKEG
ncbi:hypothetical protein L2E82_06095 [Cichorium intybus]|uniref:Uncharacterized protein n=1 Tax=Cichorium intybus TaxID=13427 RepID=A0ACB9HB99_CICIN|nr:hypothetical protein L2E82_06095 [Cichorium intybus]